MNELVVNEERRRPDRISEEVVFEKFKLGSETQFAFNPIVGVLEEVLRELPD